MWVKKWSLKGNTIYGIIELNGGVDGKDGKIIEENGGFSGKRQRKSSINGGFNGEYKVIISH
jgi:hypothetical protein